MTLEPDKNKPETDSCFETCRLDTQQLDAVRVRSLHSDSLHPGEVLLDQFQVKEKLGSGGSADVYLVKHQFTDNLFAVKIPKLNNEFEDIRQRMLMREVRTWLDLPHHPNLAACRFTRTLHGKFILFAEYIDGEPLDELIRSNRITDLRTILDISIQMAWGLEAAHKWGVIHRDVKPANILIQKDGIVRITDFGLARGLEAAPEDIRDTPADDHNENSLESIGFMTPAYCSPEQALRKKLNHQTDIWSFGLTVLTMFTGRPVWNSGALAEDLFKKYLSSDTSQNAVEMIPAVTEVLLNCFKTNLSKRWNSFGDISKTMVKIYQSIYHKPYFRTKPSFRVPDQQHDLKKYHVTDTDDADSLRWLNRAIEVSGKMNNADCSSDLFQKQRSRRSQILTGIERYECAVELFQETIAEGRVDLQQELVHLLMIKSEQHSIMSDHSGQIEALNQGIAILKDMTSRESDSELLGILADGYVRLGRACDLLRQLEKAVKWFDTAAEIILGISDSLRTGDHERILGRALISKGTALLNLGDYDEARTIIQRGLDHIKSHKQLIPKDRFEDMLAIGTMNLASAAWSLNDNKTAIKLYNDVIHLIESSQGYETQIQNIYRIAMAQSNLGLCHYKDSEMESTLRHLYHALKLLRKLVFDMDQDQFSSDFVLICSNLGAILEETGEIEKAFEVLTEAIQFHEDIVFNDGRNELLDQLALLYRNKASVLVKRGNRLIAYDLYNSALNIWNYLYLRNEGANVLENATEAREWKCDALLLDLKIEEALEELRQASHNLEIMIFTFDRLDLKAVYNRILLKRACLMDRLGNETAAREYLFIYQNKIQFCPESKDIKAKHPWTDQFVSILKKYNFSSDVLLLSER